MNYLCEIETPLGVMTAASDGEAVTGLWFDKQKYYLASIEGRTEYKDAAIFDLLKSWLERYFKGENPELNVELKPNGSAFRLRVWKELLKIPYGTTTTYGVLAKVLASESGGRASALAAGGAVAHNPLSILIPCHRVVGSDGSLTGYAGGVEKKAELLRLEGADMDYLYIPQTSALYYSYSR